MCKLAPDSSQVSVETTWNQGARCSLNGWKRRARNGTVWSWTILGTSSKTMLGVLSRPSQRRRSSPVRTIKRDECNNPARRPKGPIRSMASRTTRVPNSVAPFPGSWFGSMRPSTTLDGVRSHGDRPPGLTDSFGSKAYPYQGFPSIQIHSSGIVPNRASTDLTLCAVERRSFGASAGGKTNGPWGPNGPWGQTEFQVKLETRSDPAEARWPPASSTPASRAP